MDTWLVRLIDRLINSVTDDDFVDVAIEVIDILENKPGAFTAVEPILKLMESYPEVDFGTPGPLVHFVERYYTKGYEEELVNSLQRRPTKHTVWMLNRIINGCEGDRKTYFLDVLDQVLAHTNLDSNVQLVAQHFRTLHE